MKLVNKTVDIYTLKKELAKLIEKECDSKELMEQHDDFEQNLQKYNTYNNIKQIESEMQGAITFLDRLGTVFTQELSSERQLPKECIDFIYKLKENCESIEAGIQNKLLNVNDEINKSILSSPREPNSPKTPSGGALNLSREYASSQSPIKSPETQGTLKKQKGLRFELQEALNFSRE